MTAPSPQPTGIAPTAQSWHEVPSPHGYPVLAGWAGDTPPPRPHAISPVVPPQLLQLTKKAGQEAAKCLQLFLAEDWKLGLRAQVSSAPRSAPCSGEEAALLQPWQTMAVA